VREAESRTVLADFPFVIPGWEMFGEPQADPVKASTPFTSMQERDQI